MVVEDRRDRGRIARRDRLPKREILGQHLGRLQQTLTVLVQQPQEHAFADLQFFGVALARDSEADAIDEHQHARLHHGEQEREDENHSAAEAA